METTTIVPGSIASLLHGMTQALLVPVLVLLLASLLYLAHHLGRFAREWWGYRGLARGAPADWMMDRKEVLETALGEGENEDGPGGSPARRAERLVSHEEFALLETLERTDLLVRVGPVLGLAGTLIPLGPGLSALGRGETAVLAQALTVAFDTTIIGILVGAAAFIVSTVRRRWYERYLQWLTGELERVLEEGDALDSQDHRTPQARRAVS